MLNRYVKKKQKKTMIILFKIKLLLLLYKGRPSFSEIFLIITIIINTSIQNVGFLRNTK